MKKTKQKVKVAQKVEAAASKRKTQLDLNPIPLFEPQPPPHAAVVKGKLELKLRTMELGQELKGIPKTAVELHQIVLQMRQRRYEATYQGVLAYLKLLQGDPSFYRKFGYGTIDEYNLVYGIGTGTYLAKLIALVKLFEFKTFVLVGNQLLNEMILKLMTVQASAAARKRDIRLIFERYCERYERFDREAFRHTVRSYINEQYPPLTVSAPAPAAGKKGRKELLPASRGSKNIAVGSSDETSDHKLHQKVCPGCEWGDRNLHEYEKLAGAYECYIRLLVRVIADVLNGKHLLSHIDVPIEVRAYRKLHGLPAHP